MNRNAPSEQYTAKAAYNPSRAWIPHGLPVQVECWKRKQFLASIGATPEQSPPPQQQEVPAKPSPVVAKSSLRAASRRPQARPAAVRPARSSSCSQSHAAAQAFTDAS